MWNRVHIGISEAEASKKRNGSNWEGDWKAQPLAVNKRKDGIIVIVSIPSDKGSDIMLGFKWEIWLFPDGTYAGEIVKSWLSPSKEREYMEGRAPKFKNGCKLHPSCLSCPEPDCVF